MATLIQSKQIEGIVTASVIEGTFQVSGSQIITGSQELSGDITASNIRVSGNYRGDGSLLTFGGTGIVSGSSQINYNNIFGIPAFIGGDNITIISGSGGITISSADAIPITSLNIFTSSIQTEVDGLSAVTSSYLTQVPSGTVSGSIQVLGGTNLVSSSKQITDLGFISSSDSIASLNTFTSSIQTEVDGLSASTSSYLTSLDSGILSSSAQITALGFVSESTDVQTLSFNQVNNNLTISDGNSVDLSSLSGGGGGGGSSIWSTGSNWYFVSSDLKITGSVSATSFTGSIDYSNLTNVPSNILSSSAQITALGFVSESGDSTPSGTISGSSQITALGFVSESGGENTSLNSYTSSTDLRLTNIESTTSSFDSRLDNVESVTGSYLTSSGSVDYTDLTSVPSNLVSGSSQLTSSYDTRYALSGSGGGGSTNISSLNTFTSSIQTEVDGLSAVTSSYITSLPSGLLSGSKTEIPSGTVSSSEQITALGFVSESGGSTPSGTISGSSQITALGFVSESVDLVSLNTFTASNANASLNSYTSSLRAGVRFFHIENTTQSLDSRLDTVEAATSSYLVSSGSVDFTDITSIPSGIVSSSEQLPNGIISGSSQITSLGFISESQDLPSGVISGSSQLTSSYDVRYQSSGSSIPFNGNRIVSQEKLPTMFTSSFNPGTSGSVIDFLNAIFYPNSEPSITSTNQTISEFSGSGTSIFTIEATDPEGQSLTFGTSSTYTDDLVRVSSVGVVTLNATATSASFNTDLVGGSHGHTFVASVEDTFGAVVTKDITIFVTPNQSPQFRETSAVGNVITTVTSNLNENSADGTLVKRVFFTDDEGDSITIDSSSISPAGGSSHFTITKYSTYIDIEQNTGSLDYETYPVYTFSLSASDEHYQNSEDSDSIVTLPISISVVDNVHPTINNQTLTSINENSSNGATIGTISATDSEGDAITFSQFTLYKLELDNVNVSSGSYGGTSQGTDPHENPFNMDSSGNVTRKNGVFLNSDLINEYQYTVRVRDSFNTASNEAIVTIPIDDDTPAILSDNWSAGPYIKESQNSGSTIRTTDYGATVADYNSNQSGTFSSSNPSITITPSGNLSISIDLSGSVTQSGDTIDSTITFTNTFGTTTTDDLSVNVIANDAPTATFTNQSSNLNQNLAVANANLVLVSITDTEGDSPYSASLSGTDASKLNLDYQNSNSSSVYIRANEDLTTGTYNYNIRVTDSYSKSTDYLSRDIVIANPDIGTLGGDTTSYIIESAVSGALIRESSNGRTGNQSQLTVSYSPNYGSQVVDSFTSSIDDIISIDDSGNLTLAVDLSGSSTSSGDTITPTITFQDQYGNIGSGSVTINVASNQAPTATFTNQSSNFVTDLSTTGTTMVSMSISDTESDTPFSASISGSNLQLIYSSADSSSVGIQASNDLTARTHTYSITVFDQFGKSTTYSNRTFTVTQSSDYGKTYIYRSNYGSDAGLSSNYNVLMGASTVSGDTPPEVTAYTANASSPFRLISSSLGESSLSLAGGSTATLVDTISGSSLDAILNASNPLTMGNTAEQYIIIVPSGSDMVGIPTSMTDGFADNTVGRYVMAVKADGGLWGAEPSDIHLLDTSGSVNGYDKHFIIGRSGHNAAASVEIRLIEASGSLPS